jgi:hypothetical protein
MIIAVWYKDRLIYTIEKDEDFDIKDIEILQSKNGETWEEIKLKES